MSQKEYVNWVRGYDHGLHKKKDIGPYTFDVQYKPSDFIVISNQQGQVDKSSLSKGKKELDGWMYFTLKIKNKEGDFIRNSNNRDETNQRQYYFSFGFKNDIHLMDGTTKIPCALFHFERSYDVTDYKTFVLGFVKAGSNSGDKVLVLDSRPIGMGMVKIEFDQKDIDNAPTIKL